MKDRIINSIFILFLILLFLVRSQEPKKIDWSPSYSKDESIPMGTQVLFEQFNELYPQSNITLNEKPLYNSLAEKAYTSRSVFIINQQLFADDLDIRSLLLHVEKGNIAFISLSAFPSQLLYELNIEFDSDPIHKIYDADSVGVALKSETDFPEFIYPKRIYKSTYFSRIDSSTCQILGINQSLEPNYISVNYGSGKFYLHGLPEVFCNYFLLYDSSQPYTEQLLQKIPIQKQVLWDNYYGQKPKVSSSPLRYILSQFYLKIALYIGLLAMLIYFLFESKRRRAEIPIKAPKYNNQLAFIKQVATTAQSKEEHLEAAKLLWKHFESQAFKSYKYIPDPSDENAVEHFANKSGLSSDLIEDLFSEKIKLDRRDELSESGLRRFYNKVYPFIFSQYTDN